MKLAYNQYKLLEPFRKHQNKISRRIKFIVKQLNVHYNNSSSSYYFNHNGLDYRLSTHPCLFKHHSKFDVNIIVTQDSDIQSIIRFIQLIHRDQ